MIEYPKKLKRGTLIWDEFEKRIYLVVSGHPHFKLEQEHFTFNNLQDNILDEDEDEVYTDVFVSINKRIKL